MFDSLFDPKKGLFGSAVTDSAPPNPADGWLGGTTTAEAGSPIKKDLDGAFAGLSDTGQGMAKGLGNTITMAGNTIGTAQGRDMSQFQHPEQQSAPPSSLGAFAKPQTPHVAAPSQFLDYLRKLTG